MGMAIPEPIYECECEGPKKLYTVTGHDGRHDTVRYCEDCAALAEIDWNGETDSIVALDPPRGVCGTYASNPQ